MFNPSLSHRQTLKINVCTFIWWLPQINQIKTEVLIKPIRRLQDAQTNAITLPAHPFLLINNVKELKGRNLKPSKPASPISSAPRLVGGGRVIGP